MLELNAVFISELRSVFVGEGDVRDKRARDMHGCTKIKPSSLDLPVKCHDLGL